MTKTDVDRLKPIKNKCWFMCLPFLADNIAEFRNLRGCFIGDEEYPQYDQHIFTLFFLPDSPGMEYLLLELKISNDHVDTYYPDKDHIMFVFRPKPSQLDDYKNFRESKYSELSITYRQHIIMFHNITGERHRLVRGLFKHPALRRQLMEDLDCYIPKEQELLSLLGRKEVFKSIEQLNIDIEEGSK